MLTNAAGMTLYTFDKDAAGRQERLQRPLRANWPPLWPRGRQGRPGRLDSIVTRDDGTKQWAYKGKPLYTWAKDAQARRQDRRRLEQRLARRQSLSPTAGGRWPSPRPGWASIRHGRRGAAPIPTWLPRIPRLRRYARVLTGDAKRADDLVQDTLARAWEKRRLWRAGTDLRAWLFTVMHNVFVNQRALARREALNVSSTRTARRARRGSCRSRPNQQARVELAELLVRVGRLPAEQREVLLLAAVEELHYEEIAAVLDDSDRHGDVPAVARPREAAAHGGRARGALKVVKWTHVADADASDDCRRSPTDLKAYADGQLAARSAAALEAALARDPGARARGVAAPRAELRIA